MATEPLIVKSETAQALINQLKNPFPKNLLKYRIGAKTKDKSKAVPLFYITSRDIFTRLDQIVGPENWYKETEIVRNEKEILYAKTTIYINFNGRWVGKDGVGEPSKTSSIKGAESDSIKRAAVSWGIGRYLYFLPNNLWMPIDQYGHFESDPRNSLPNWALPNNNVEDWEEVAQKEYTDDGQLDFENLNDYNISEEEKELLRKSEEVRKQILARQKES